MRSRLCHLAVWAVLILSLLTACSSGKAAPSAQGAPQRIISLLPSATELVYEVGQGDKLVGVTLNDDYPPQVAELPKVGDQTIDMEKVVSLEPDLVILDSQFNRDKQALQRLGLSVLELRCERLEDVAESLRVLGRELDCEKVAEGKAKAFEDKLAEVKQLQLEGTVFVEVWGSPLMTVGSKTLINDVLHLLGIKNAYLDQEGYFQVDPEDVLARQPSIVLLPAGDPETESEALKLFQRVNLKAKLVRIDADLLVRPSPRLLQGLAHLEEAFKSQD